MASVVRGYLESSSDRYRHTSVIAWAPGTMWSRLRTFATAYFLLRLRSPRATWAMHVHATQGGDLLRAAVVTDLAARLDVPVVVTIHGSRFPVAAARHRRVVARLLRSATAVTCLTAETRDAVARLGTTASPIVVRNAVSTSIQPPRPTPGLVVFAGEVGTRKGVDVLLAAWPGVTALAPGARLVIAGPCVEPGLLASLPDGTEYRGDLTAGELDELLDLAWLVVLPSRAEALPMALLEAMTHGVPFVATPVGEVTALAAGGRLVAVDDATALTTAVAGLVNDSAERHRLGAAARRLATSDYSRQVVDAAMYDIYDALRGVDA